MRDKNAVTVHYVDYTCLTCMCIIPCSVAASLMPRKGSTRREWCPRCEAITNQRME